MSARDGDGLARAGDGYFGGGVAAAAGGGGGGNGRDGFGVATVASTSSSLRLEVVASSSDADCSSAASDAPDTNASPSSVASFPRGVVISRGDIHGIRDADFGLVDGVGGVVVRCGFTLGGGGGVVGAADATASSSARARAAPALTCVGEPPALAPALSSSSSSE